VGGGSTAARSAHLLSSSRTLLGAATLWTAIDHELVDRAYWVPPVNLGVADLVSSRLGNYQSHPLSGFIPGQPCWVKLTRNGLALQATES